MKVTFEVTLPPAVYEELKQLAEDGGLSPSVFFGAIWRAFLKRMEGSTRISQLTKEEASDD